MYQNLHPISPFVGKYIGMMRHCLSEVPNDSGQGRIGPGTHIHRLVIPPFLTVHLDRVYWVLVAKCTKGAFTRRPSVYCCSIPAVLTTVFHFSRSCSTISATSAGDL